MADKPAPSAWAIQKALAAWRAAQMEAPDDPDLEHASFVEEIQPGDDAVQSVLQRLIRAAVTADDMADSAKRREGAIKARRERFEIRSEMLRKIITQLMETIGQKSAMFSDCSASLSAGKPSVSITDIEKLPVEYRNTATTVTANKKLIMADLAEGVVIDGVELSNGGTTLTLRSK